MIIRINSVLPSEVATTNSVGVDLRAIEDVVIPFIGDGKHWGVVPTGVTLELPEGIEAQVRPRSGLAANHGVTVLNSPGTIDSDYRGEVGVILANLGDETFVIKKGDKIAQLVFSDVILPSTIEGVNIKKVARGSKGFGSSGKR